MAGEDLDPVSQSIELRGSNEDAFESLAGERPFGVGFERSDEAIDLPPVSVSVHRHIQRFPPRRVFRALAEQNGSGAGAECSQCSVAQSLSDRLPHVVEPEELVERRTLSAGEDEVTDALEFLGLANLDRVNVESRKRRAVGFDRPLKGEHADPGWGRRSLLLGTGLL